MRILLPILLFTGFSTETSEQLSLRLSSSYSTVAMMKQPREDLFAMVINFESIFDSHLLQNFHSNLKFDFSEINTGFFICIFTCQILLVSKIKT